MLNLSMCVLTRTGDGRFYPAQPDGHSPSQHDKIGGVRAQSDERRRLRIAHLTTADISLALLLSTELSEAVKEGHEVVGISAPGPYVSRVEALGVSHVAVPELTRSWNVPQDLRAFISLGKTLRSLDLDVLHTHNPKTGVMGRIAGRLVGVPVVVNTCHGLWATPEDPVTKRAFVYGVEALAARFSDYELFQNAQDEETLHRFLKRGRHKVVGNGIDLERFRFDPFGRARLRSEWGVGEDEILIGTVGRRVREKGLVEYAAAAAALRSPARFVWVGPADNTEHGAQPADHERSVLFIPERTDMPAVYSAFDIFVLASYREGFSRASMEAAACGRPLVLTDIRGCREIGGHDEHLLLVPPRSARELELALRRLLLDSGLRVRLGSAAAQRAHHEFDQRAISRVSRETYLNVRDQKGLAFDPRPGRGEARPVTVLHVLPDDMNRGAQVYARQLRDALTEDPEQRHLLVALFEGPEDSQSADVRLRTRSGHLRRAGLDPRALHRLKRAIKQLDADVVVAHGGESLKYVVAAGLGSSTVNYSTVYYKVGLSSTELARPGRVALYRLLAARTSQVVAVSHSVLDQCHRVLGVPMDKLSVIPNGRDPGIYHPPEVVQPSTCPPLILWIGRFESGKRPATFLDVVEGVKGGGRAIEAMMVGDGPLFTSLQLRGSAAGVDLSGVRDDVPSLMRRATVLAMTSASDTEGMPGVLIEAGLSALPVVATSAAGVDDVVVSGRTGFVVSSEDTDEMVVRIQQILNDAELARRLGRGARARCIEMFSVGSTALQWRHLVDTLRWTGRGFSVTDPHLPPVPTGHLG